MNAVRLSSGTAFGAYEILAPLGSGGMGDVVRARDVRLGREVALKLLADHVRLDPHRRARFEREARMLASLNHPNIAALHGIEEVGGVQALVLELVEGPTLADRLAEGPLPLATTVAIALQIAAALEAAHARGIVHRDLKPANVKLRADGTVKLLDFGLAKAFDATGGSDPRAATVTVIEQPGAVLGTPAYMSPEQARGQAVDPRTDIWSFGCVLYEMLTGHPAFPGDHATDVLAKILERDADFDALPAATPAPVRHLLHRCLTKDATDRLRDIGDARVELADVARATPQSRGRVSTLLRKLGGRPRALLAVAAVVALALAAPRYATTFTKPVAVPPPIRYTLGVTAQRDAMRDRAIAISRDGKRFAWLSEQGLFVRGRDQLESRFVRRMPSMAAGAPFFSPDGRWIAFSDGQALWRVPFEGGNAMKIVDVGPAAVSSWDPDGLVYADMGGLHRVDTERGESRLLLATPGAVEQVMCPQLLPGGHAVIFTAVATRTHTPARQSDANIAHVDVLDLRTGERRTLVQGGGRGRYHSSGHLTYAMRDKLFALPFDLGRLQTRGEPIEVGPANGVADLAVSDEGTLLYQPPLPNPDSVLVWVDRDGNEEALGTPPHQYIYPRLSPDGSRIAIDAWIDDDRDVWTWNLERRVLEQFTVDPTSNSLVAWTPDGERLVFGSDRLGISNLFMQSADGSGEPRRLIASEQINQPLGFAPDGRLLFSADVPGQGRDVRALSIDGSRVESVLASKANDLTADVSPDGRWIAYDSDESGHFEVYVRPYPATGAGGRWQISSGGGRQPLWSRDGRELYFRDFKGAMMAVPIRAGGGFAAGAPAKLFAHPDYAGAGSSGSARTYDLSRDGRRFLMVRRQPVDPSAQPQLTVVLNWFGELERLAPTTAR